MGRDTHVEKDPENRKGKSERAPEPSSLLHETLDHELADSNNRKMNFGPNSVRGGYYSSDPGFEELRELNERLLSKPTQRVTHDTKGSGFYKVGNDIGNGVNIVKISIEEVKPEECPMIKRTLVNLSNGACLNLEDNHIRSVFYPSDKPGVDRNIDCSYDKDGMLKWVCFSRMGFKSSDISIDIWERVGPNKWHNSSPEKIWHGRLEMDKSGELKLFNAKGELHTIYSTDGKAKRLGRTRGLE